jgi:hypothetical protein
MVKTARSGAVVRFRNARQLIATTRGILTLIFSLLKLRKKTSAVLAGILIGVTCLWGVSMWQDIPPRQLFDIFLASFVFILGLMVAAILIVLVFNLIRKLIRATVAGDDSNDKF